MKPDFQMKTICLLLVLPCQTVFADTGHQEVEHVDMDTVKVSGKRQAQRNTERSQSYTIGTMATADWLAYFRQGYAAVGERNDASAAR